MSQTATTPETILRREEKSNLEKRVQGLGKRIKNLVLGGLAGLVTLTLVGGISYYF